MKQLFLSVAMICMCSVSFAQKQMRTTPGNMNPIIPGYFADPTIRKFGDTYYLYATTDGNGGGLGPSQVWTSKDFVNWTYQDMNWPTTYHYWAPDVTLGNDGKYYMYYCQPVEIFGASSDSPVGPWTPLLSDNKPVIPNYFVPGVITLDGQTFRDDDGKMYMYWGTWGIYPDHGCGVGLLNADMKSFSKTSKIPNTIAKDFFEAPYMFKRKGIYYLTYSSGRCEDETYRVQYVMSTTSPMDGFTYGKNNPVLVTNADKTVHGPGHQSVIQIGEEFYLVYHRHDNPNSGGGFHRQICIDRLVFDEEGNIEKLEPTHTGVGFLGKNSNPYPNRAYLKKVTASSYYNEDYKPEFAVDNNNGTLWKPAHNSTANASLQIDLSEPTKVKRILTEFEYPSWYYQYKLEYSVNGTQWKIYADRTNNKVHGSPMIDDGDVTARYIRITITGTENPGMYKALWNIKVYSDRSEWPAVIPNLPKPPKADITYKEKGLLIDLDADAFQPGTQVTTWKNNGTLEGAFSALQKSPITEVIAGKKAVIFNGTQVLESSFQVPLSLSGNSSYTVSFWVYTQQIKEEAPIISWAFGGRDLNNAVFGFGKQQNFGAVQHGGFSDMPFNRKVLPEPGRWQQVTISFDGTFEKVYINGELNNQENKMLFIQTTKNFVLGAKNTRQPLFHGAIASLKVYDYALTEKEIKVLYQQPDQSAVAVYLNAAKLDYGSLHRWKNEGNAGGFFVAKGESPVVKDVAGKIALHFSGKEALVSDSLLSANIKKFNQYSIAIGMYTSALGSESILASWSANKYGQLKADIKSLTDKWNFIIQTYDGRTIETYINGILTAKTAVNQAVKPDLLYLGTDSENHRFTGAISQVSFFNNALSKNDILSLTTVWNENLQIPVSGNPVFKQLPAAVTPNMVMMEAMPASGNRQLNYYFARLDQENKGEWSEKPIFIDYTVKANQEYQYAFKIKDHYGNVTNLSSPVHITTNTDQFLIHQDLFSQTKNFLIDGTTGSIWKGFIGKGEKESAIVIGAGNESLKLESKATNWDGNVPYGPYLYREVKGDFVAEVMVTDVSGLDTKRVTGNNEVGLMVRLPNDTITITNRRPQERLIQNSIFPAWNVGNLFTNFQNGRREQNNTQAAWDFNKYLQIQRTGNTFYVRTSKDGKNWINMPGSPVLRNDMDNKQVQIGVYQSTYGPTQGYGHFSNFRLIERK